MTNQQKNLIVFPAQDLARAKAIYGALLGVAPYVDSPYYVGFRTGELEVGLDPRGHKDGATAYWMVPDLDAAARALVEAGATIVEPAKDVGGGLLVAVLKDADGNRFGLRQNP